MQRRRRRSTAVANVLACATKRFLNFQLHPGPAAAKAASLKTARIITVIIRHHHPSLPLLLILFGQPSFMCTRTRAH